MTQLYSDDAELYDIAFDWDVTDEVTWLLERLGRECRFVLEPACGSGRMLEAFARRGVEITGFDNSRAMLELARGRLDAAGVTAKVLEADMTDFDLGRTFGGAICPINTLGHLSRDELGRHLDCLARHLEPGARYLVQVGLVERDRPLPGVGSSWEASRGDTKLRASWASDFDFDRGVANDRSRIEVLEGPRAGDVIEEQHPMTVWGPQTWPRLIEASSFTQARTYDGNERDRPPVGPDATGGLLWHELVRSSP